MLSSYYVSISPPTWCWSWQHEMNKPHKDRWLRRGERANVKGLNRFLMHENRELIIVYRFMVLDEHRIM